MTTVPATVREKEFVVLCGSALDVTHMHICMHMHAHTLAHKRTHIHTLTLSHTRTDEEWIHPKLPRMITPRTKIPRTRIPWMIIPWMNNQDKNTPVQTDLLPPSTTLRPLSRTFLLLFTPTNTRAKLPENCERRMLAEHRKTPVRGCVRV